MPRIANNPKKVQFDMSLGRLTSNDPQVHDTFLLTITDSSSRTLLIDISLDARQFADLMSTRIVSNCDGVFYGAEHVGKKCEHQEVVFKMESTQAALDKACENYVTTNKEGWKTGNQEFNYHRYDCQSGTYKITVFRYV